MSTSRKLPPSLYFEIFDVKRRKSEDRKITIIEAVIECLATKGTEGTTFDAIGKMVKMERTHVSYYFSSRKDLIKTAVRYAVAVGQQITIGHVRNADTWRERLKGVIEGPFEWIEQYPKHAAVMALFYYLCSYDRDFRKLQTQIQAGGEARLVGALQTLVENETLSRVTAIELARTIQSLMSGTLHYCYSCDYPLSAKGAKAKTVQIGLRLVESALK